MSALYLSMVTLATLGFGDITPAQPELRLLAPLEALLGFVLLTAAISWILQVYPALGRRRSLAKRLSILRSAATTELLTGGAPCVATRLLETVMEGVIQVETDLVQYAESYYFLEEEDTLSLPVNLPFALEMAAAGGASSSPEVRLAAELLSTTVESLADPHRPGVPRDRRRGHRRACRLRCRPPRRLPRIATQRCGTMPS